MKRILISIVMVLAVIVNGQHATAQDQLQLDSIFDGYQGTFVLYDANTDVFKEYNAERAKQQFSVHSTSKIVWSIIGLEEDLIPEESTVVRWDSVQYPRQDFWPKGWNQDQTVVSALKYSVNWYYQELMKKMTPELIEKYLYDLNYTKDFEVEQAHYFGLTYQIEKSALEQIEFLKSLYNNEFNLYKSTVETVKKGMLQERKKDYTFYYKTGAGEIKNGNCIGWVIGFVEKDDGLYYFAMNMEDKDFKNIPGKRIVITKEALKGLKII